ncbi:protein new-glue 1 [Drosophila subobscura]|uniref:protein new-glue 1 n=1 Tax=Drosophila subobscura TaxID=7241 RepID=UPI00155A6F8A|nr:protein new-glue 1 [Drosophila subobscura]
MTTVKLALGLLAVSLCIWMANATGSSTTSAATTTTVAATTTAAATTTTTAAATTTTTTAATTAATSTVRRKKIRISNLKFSSSRRIRVYRSSTVSSLRSRSRLGRRLVRARSGNRVLSRILNQRRNQG